MEFALGSKTSPSGQQHHLNVKKSENRGWDRLEQQHLNHYNLAACGYSVPTIVQGRDYFFIRSVHQHPLQKVRVAALRYSLAHVTRYTSYTGRLYGIKRCSIFDDARHVEEYALQTSIGLQ